MNLRAISWIVAAAFFIGTSSLGLFVVPRFRQIIADLLPSESLPLMTRLVLSAGASGYVAFAAVGAILLVVAGGRQCGRWPHTVVVLLFALVLFFTVLALFKPLMMLQESVG